MSEGKEVNSGVEVSAMVMVCVAFALFPASSVATNVLTTTYSPSSFPAVVSTLTVTCTGPQLSSALAISVGSASPHSPGVSVGTDENSGGVVSSTVMVCVAEAALP